MTRFSGPLKVKRPFEETTVASIDVSGSAKFNQGVSMGGVLVVSGASTLHGRPQVGDSGSRGDILLTQSRSVSAGNTTNTTAATVPDGSDVLDIRVFVDTAFATAAADVEFRVGTSANETLFGVISMDTDIATGMHVLAGTSFTSAGSAWTNLSGAGAQIMIQVTAVSGAIASGASGTVFVTYIV